MRTSAASASSWKLSSASAEAVRDRLRLWRADPVLFASEVLGVDLWDGPGDSQAKVARAFVHHPLIAVRSGQKVGKSTEGASLILWSAALHPGRRVVFTAPAAHQVENVMWPEVRRLFQRAALRGFPLGGRLYEVFNKGLKYREGWEAFGLTTNDPVKFAGLSSSEKIVLVVDEASGFPEAIFDAVFGNLAGGGQVLLLGNPTQTSGTFYQAFKKRGSWKTFHIRSLDTPNFRGGHVPGLATPWWHENVAKVQWGGPGNPAYDVRVLGEFPTQGSDAVIYLGLVEVAANRYELVPESGRLELGVDVARYGDDETVIYPRRGYKALPAEVMQGKDEVYVAGSVLEKVRELRRSGERAKVKVDVIGPGGGVASILKQHRDDVEVLEVNVASNATAEGYHRLRDQLWFACRDWLQEGGALPEDPKLEAELVAPVYDFDTQGRYRVSSKDDIKKQLGRSPDRADALCLAVYSPPAAAEGPAEEPEDLPKLRW
jgi:phage terminase large subunit